METNWLQRPLGLDEIGKTHFDTRVLSPVEGGGALVVCDTFKEFAPLLASARELRAEATRLREIVTKLARQDPNAPSEIDGDPSCFFCGAHWPKVQSDHDADCLWVQANRFAAANPK